MDKVIITDLISETENFLREKSDVTLDDLITILEKFNKLPYSMARERVVYTIKRNIEKTTTKLTEKITLLDALSDAKVYANINVVSNQISDKNDIIDLLMYMEKHMYDITLSTLDILLSKFELLVDSLVSEDYDKITSALKSASRSYPYFDRQNLLEIVTNIRTRLQCDQNTQTLNTQTLDKIEHDLMDIISDLEQCLVSIGKEITAADLNNYLLEFEKKERTPEVYEIIEALKLEIKHTPSTLSKSQKYRLLGLLVNIKIKLHPKSTHHDKLDNVDKFNTVDNFDFDVSTVKSVRFEVSVINSSLLPIIQMLLTNLKSNCLSSSVTNYILEYQELVSAVIEEFTEDEVKSSIMVTIDGILNKHGWRQHHGFSSEPNIRVIHEDIQKIVDSVYS